MVCFWSLSTSTAIAAQVRRVAPARAAMPVTGKVDQKEVPQELDSWGPSESRLGVGYTGTGASEDCDGSFSLRPPSAFVSIQEFVITLGVFDWS